MTNATVFYHAHCTDGFGSAFAAWCKLGDTAEYVPVQYGQIGTCEAIAERFDCSIGDRTVYILDFSFPAEVMRWLLGHAKNVVWLDHHKTAFEMWCPDSPTKQLYLDHCEQCHITLDNNKSGALLAWEYFHPEKDIPWLISRIDDRDRWVFQYEDSRALHAGLQRLGFNFNSWAGLVPAMGGSSLALAQVIDIGRTILSVYNDQIKARVKVAESCAIPYDTRPTPRPIAAGLAVNSPIHQSEIGNELAKASGTYGLVWYYDAATKRANVSLRSIGDYDVSAIAKAFGGGGHKNAAGFNIDVPTLLGWLK